MAIGTSHELDGEDGGKLLIVIERLEKMAVVME